MNKTNLFVVDDTAWIGVWSVVEACVGIVAACLPPMAPLYRRLIKHRLLNYRTWWSSTPGTGSSSDTAATSTAPARKPDSNPSDTEKTLTASEGVDEGDELKTQPTPPALASIHVESNFSVIRSEGVRTDQDPRV